ncbi:MAG: hypothetical protein ABUK01_15910 [Leptospirales bacterium]
MKQVKPLNKKALAIAEEDTPDVFACAPIPKPDCTSNYAPGIEVSSATSSTDQNASTKGLCSPFLRDTMICSCSYWPSQDPDLTVQETASKWRNGMGHGQGHGVNSQELRFVYPTDPKSDPNRAYGNGKDSWDKNVPSDINEIMIKDNWADTGSVPTSGNTWTSPDIWLRYNNEPESNFPDPNLNYHQGNPIVNRNNYLYARVRNTGQHVIDQVYVKFYAGLTSTNPSGILVGHGMVREMAAQSVAVVKSIKPWAPNVTGHGCIRVIIDSTQDPVKLLGSPPNFNSYNQLLGPQFQDVSVAYDNNVAQLNLSIITVIPGWAGIPFDFVIMPKIPPIIDDIEWPPRPLPEPDPNPEWHKIILERPLALSRLKLETAPVAKHLQAYKRPFKFSISKLFEVLYQLFLPILSWVSPSLTNHRKRLITYMPTEKDRPVKHSLMINLDRVAHDDQYMDHSFVIKQAFKGKTLGGITVRMNVTHPSLVRYIADTDTKVAHFFKCPEIKQIPDNRKRGFDDPNEALAAGYAVHDRCDILLARRKGE